jgi:hypothetical protein
VTRLEKAAMARLLVLLGMVFAAPSIGAPGLAAQEGKTPGGDLERAVVQSICPKQMRTETLKNGMAYGCGGCPSFTSFAGEAPSKGKQPDFELRKVLAGSFTRAGAKEVLAEFFGCEPHAANFGGTMILEQSDSALKRLGWIPGPVGLIRTFRRNDGRDLVLSQGGYMGQGEATDWVSTYDFSKPDPSGQTLITVSDDTLNACTSEQVNVGNISGVEFPGANGNGQPALRVKVQAGKAKVPAIVRENCDVEFKPPAVPSYTVDFVFDGESFRVTPSTAAALKRVNSAQE